MGGIIGNRVGLECLGNVAATEFLRGKYLLSMKSSGLVLALAGIHPLWA
jgi:hypothetical protein